MAAKLDFFSDENYYHTDYGHLTVENLIETANSWRNSICGEDYLAARLRPPTLSLPPQAFERNPSGLHGQDVNVSLEKESIIVSLYNEDPYARLPSSPYLGTHQDYYAVYSFLQNGSSVSTSFDKQDHFVSLPETPVSAQSILSPKRCSGHSKAPRLVQIQNEEPVIPWRTVSSSPTDPVGKFPVTLNFSTRKAFLAVILNSGEGKEYTLPIFKDLLPLSVMKGFKHYEPKKEFQKDDEVQVVRSGEINQVSIKRYESRLTLVQLAWILGLQDYNISLTKDVESIVLTMFDQLCGFKIGDKTWSRGISKDERKRMIARVHKYAIIYFPTFTRGIVEVIIKRGAYSRTQEFLRRKRRRQKRSVEIVYDSKY